jgi:hypothetical protein
MNTLNQSIEQNHRLIIYTLAFVVLFMATSCVFNDAIPVCHWIFGCDHNLHLTGRY